MNTPIHFISPLALFRPRVPYIISEKWPPRKKKETPERDLEGINQLGRRVKAGNIINVSWITRRVSAQSDLLLVLIHSYSTCTSNKMTRLVDDTWQRSSCSSRQKHPRLCCAVNFLPRVASKVPTRGTYSRP